MFQRPEIFSARPCEIPGTFAISSTLAYVNLANRPYISTTFADVLAHAFNGFQGTGIFDLRPFFTVPPIA